MWDAGSSWADFDDRAYLAGYEDAKKAADFFAANDVDGAAEGYVAHVRAAQAELLPVLQPGAGGADREAESLAQLAWTYRTGQRMLYEPDIEVALIDGLGPDLANRVFLTRTCSRCAMPSSMGQAAGWTPNSWWKRWRRGRPSVMRCPPRQSSPTGWTPELRLSWQ